MKKFKLEITETVTLEHEITVLAESEQMLDSMINIVESLPMIKREYLDYYIKELEKLDIKVVSSYEEDVDNGTKLEFYCSDLVAYKEESQ